MPSSSPARDPDAIDMIVDRLCRTHLGAGIAEVLFRETSVGVVTGARLDDGRRVVVKAHQRREGRARLETVRGIQTRLYEAGFPCPEPLAGPVPLVNGHATVEGLLDEGEFRDTHDPTCRRLIAQALARHLQILGEQDPPAALAGGWTLCDGDRLWPSQAHAPIFDFDATSAGAEWIDALGTRARAAILRGGALIAGHSDWSGKHFRFAEKGSPRSTTGTASPFAPKRRSSESPPSPTRLGSTCPACPAPRHRTRCPHSSMSTAPRARWR